MSDLAQREFHRILIIKPSSPGDILHALPVLHALRRRYPSAHIAWLVATTFVDLIEVDPALSEVIPFDRKRFGRLGRSLSVTADFLSFVRQLRGRRFDLVVDLQGLFRSGFLAMASGASVRIGFADARELAPAFYSHRIPRGVDRDVHAVDKNLGVARLLNLNGAPPDVRLTLTAEDRAAAAQLLATVGVAEGERFAALVPGTRWETKCWPAERFGELAEKLSEQCSVKSVLIGGKDDEPLAATAIRTAHNRAANLCGRTTLRQVAAVIERAAIVVTADSTPMHMAAALGRPLVALFGPTNPSRTGPYGRMDDVLRLPLNCSPCYFRKLSQCPYGLRCMKDLSVEAVFNATVARLNPR